jgi:hypothetical protein
MMTCPTSASLKSSEINCFSDVSLLRTILFRTTRPLLAAAFAMQSPH